MVEIKKAAIMSFLLVFSSLAHPGDENGDYMGYGLVSCGKWVTYREEKNSDEEEYWIAGYITAYNVLATRTYYLMGSTDSESVYLWMDKYCRQNPLKDLADGMAILTSELYPHRTVKNPDN